MGLAMSFLRVPPVLEGEHDPERIAHRVLGVPDWRDGRPAGTLLDLDDRWHGLHYLITGDPWDGAPPASDIVCGGRLLTEDGTADLGVDVIHLAPERVKVAADHLAATGYDAVAERYHPLTMRAEGIEGDLPADPAPFRDAYEALARFFKEAATEGEAVFKVMSDLTSDA